MAGFSGGRKLICPGLAALETIKVWHGPDFLEHPNARSGVLIDNPVHEENTWVARMAGCDFIVNTVLDDQRQILSVVADSLEEYGAEATIAAIPKGPYVIATVRSDGEAWITCLAAERLRRWL